MKIFAVKDSASIPCPAGKGGWNTECGAENKKFCPSVSLEGGTILIKTEKSDIHISGNIHNGWLHAGNGGNKNIALEAKKGFFDFVSSDTVLEEVYSCSNLTVVRASTPLDINDAVAYMDLYIWGDRPLVTVLTYFDAKPDTAYFEIYVCRTTASGKGVSLYSDCYWRDCTESPIISTGGLNTWGDLNEYDAFHPYTTHIAYDGERPELPTVITSPEYSEGNVVLENGDLTVTLGMSENSLGLRSIKDRKSGYILSPSPLTSLFSLVLRNLESNDEYMLTSLYGWESVTCGKHRHDTSFIFENDDVQLKLTALMKPDESAVEWEIDVSIRNDSLTAARLDAPVLKADSQDDMMAFIALGPGRAMPFGKGGEMNITSPCPSISVCMQYMAFWRKSTGRGIYYGLHDPAACHKTLSMRQHADECSLHALIPCRGIGEASNSFRMDGSVKWQLFDGDWYDATVIYRNWVYKFANWFTGIKNENRTDVPEWMRKLPLWFQCSYSDSNKWVDDLFEAVDDIGVDTGVHMYQWHEIPFDTNYPHYNPEKSGFRRILPILQAKGIKVMPYINGRLWDTHDRGDYDYQFSSVAKPFATKGDDGEVITEHYGSLNSKKENVELGVMCPSTALWQEKQTEVTNWILNDLGADAVYVDQIAAAPPVNCIDRTHPHRPGGGSWWYEHYYNLIDHLKLHAPEGKGFTTESNAEPMVGHIGGMLVWNWSCNNNVPAFSVIYAGYETMFGRNYNAFPREDTVSFRVMTAQSLCFGDGIGWLSPELYLSSPYRAFFRSCVQKRAAYGEYFYEGTCMRPPMIEGNIPTLRSDFLSSPAVITGMWKKHSDGKTIIVLANISDEALDFTVNAEGTAPFGCSLDTLEVKIIEL